MKLKAYLLSLMLKSKHIVEIRLRVKDFPELRKYAEHLEKSCKPFSRDLSVIPIWEIEATDGFWGKVFKIVGFVYSRDERAFIFNDSDEKGELINLDGDAVTRAWKFYKALEEHGWL